MAPKMMAITLALFIVSTTVNAITPICNPIPTQDRVLCSKMTKDALTWAQAMFNAITYELALVKSGQSVAYGVGSKLPDDLEPSEKQDVIDTCNKIYNDMNEDLKKALGLIKKDPYPEALEGAIMKAYFQGCVDEFVVVTHVNAPADLTKFNDEIERTNAILVGLFFSRPKA